MPDGNLVLTSAVTLAAVGLGVWLSLIGQARASARQGSQQWRETRIATYSRFLGAVRAYVTYIRQTPQIDAISHPDGAHRIPVLGPEGIPYVQAAEAALAEVRLVARHDETVKLAVALVFSADRIAGARGETGPGLMPDAELADFRLTQINFVTAARRELKAGDRKH